MYGPIIGREHLTRTYESSKKVPFLPFQTNAGSTIQAKFQYNECKLRKENNHYFLLTIEVYRPSLLITKK